MSNTTKVALLLLSTALCSMAAYASNGKKDDDSACEVSAEIMYKACRLDVRDDYLTTAANCVNISSRPERRACFREARALRAEEKEFCEEVEEAREEACEILGEDRYDPDPLLDPGIEFIDPDQVPDVYAPNPFVSVVAGHTYVLKAGEEGEETVVVHVTEDTREILGVECRVVVDIAVEESDEGGGVYEYEAIEATDDWFAQDSMSNVYYCGEIARNFEDGVLRDLDGSFEAGLDFAKSGVLMRNAFPGLGVAHRQEFALGEAEDIIQYMGDAAVPSDDEGGENELFPCAPDGCLKTFDFAPLDPEATELKYYRPGIGFVLAVAMEDGEITGEREELVCVGDSLDILSDDPDCGIGDPDALLEELCKLSPDAFCD
jgi:hypothetical protein